jgi:hypothetical protein
MSFLDSLPCPVAELSAGAAAIASQGDRFSVNANQFLFHVSITVFKQNEILI